MLAANVCSADFIERAKHPSLYRVHEGPTPEKRALLKNYLKALGLGLSLVRSPRRRISGFGCGDQRASGCHSDSHDVAAVYAAGHLRPSTVVTLVWPMRAYTHFTSPIRRYPDLLVHRVIKALLGSARLRFGVATCSVICW